MSVPGRPKVEYPSVRREGDPTSPPGRPKDENRMRSTKMVQWASPAGCSGE